MRNVGEREREREVDDEIMVQIMIAVMNLSIIGHVCVGWINDILD